MTKVFLKSNKWSIDNTGKVTFRLSEEDTSKALEALTLVPEPFNIEEIETEIEVKITIKPVHTDNCYGADRGCSCDKCVTEVYD